MFDFEGNLIVDDLNTVPEQARPLYAEKDGKFHLSDALKPFALAYQGQTKALEKSRKDLTAANAESASRRVTKNAVAEFAKSLGIENIDEENPLASIGGFTSKLIDDGKKGKEVSVNLDKIKQESERRIGEMTTAKDGEIAKMKSSLEKYLVSQNATAALAKNGGNVDLLLDKVQKSAKVVQDGEDFVVRVVDDSGEVRSDGAGGYMTIEGLVSELKTKPQYAVAFKSEAASGTGHNPNSSAQRTNVVKTGELTANEKIAAGLKKQIRGG